MSAIVLTFPILPGKVEGWRRFCQEMAGARRRAYEDSRRRLGITHERLSLVDTAYGATAVTTMEAPSMAQVLAQIIISPVPFDVWYRQQLQELHGANLISYEQFAPKAPLPSNQEIHFEWSLLSSSEDQ